MLSFPHGSTQAVQQWMENLTIFFRRENQVCPPALSDVGSLCLGTKGDILTSFQEISDARLRTSTSTSIVLDGAPVEQMLKPDTYARTSENMQKKSLFHIYKISVFITSWLGMRHLHC
jgi:hypothetical protein